jgi:hypothetical protein
MAILEADHDHTGLGQLDVSTHRARDAARLRRVLAARQSLASPEQELHDAVRATREAPDSWTIIGAALDTPGKPHSSASEGNSPRRRQAFGRVPDVVCP